MHYPPDPLKCTLSGEPPITSFPEHQYSDVCDGYQGHPDHRIPLSANVRSKAANGRHCVRVAHVGPSFVCAGVESWLRALVAHSDPNVVSFVRNVVTEDYAVDHRLLEKLGVPFAVGNAESVQRAAMESDIVMVWGAVAPEHLKPPGSTAKVIFVAHGMGDATRHALSICRPAVDHVVAVSPIVSRSLIDVAADLPMSVIYNGVDETHIARRESAESVRLRLGFAKDDFVVGYVGRFSPEKQVNVLIDAVSQLDAPAKLLLVGWGPLRYALMDQCNSLLPGRFAFTDCRSYVGDTYQIMDALCLPSSEEGFGLVTAEAMMHGVPVIATPVGFAEATIRHQVNGLISNACAPQIAELLGQLQQHPDWAAGMGLEGRNTAQQLCMGVDMARRYEELFQSLIRSC